MGNTNYPKEKPEIPLPSQLLSPTKHTNVIYYDETIKNSDETHQYAKRLKALVRGAFIGSYNFETLKSIITEFRRYDIYPQFTVITSGSAAEKVMQFLHNDTYVKNVIIFCFYIGKYLPLMNKYKKICRVVNRIDNVLEILEEDYYPLAQEISGVSAVFKCKPLITYYEYLKYYNELHKLIARYFKPCYNDKNLYDEEIALFKDLVNNSPQIPEDARSEIIKKVESINTDKEAISNLINAYTGETKFCYGINMWLRGCDVNSYEKIKCLCGTLMYAISKYAENEPCYGLLASKTLYRRLTLRLIEINSFDTCQGELICFPGFTSTSTKDLAGIFPTFKAKEIKYHQTGGKEMINGSEDQHALMIINYEHKYGNISLATNVGKVSDSPSENEFVFPPFSFFKITGVEFGAGSLNSPHVIKLEAVGKKQLIEPALMEGGSMFYDEGENEIKVT